MQSTMQSMQSIMNQEILNTFSTQDILDNFASRLHLEGEYDEWDAYASRYDDLQSASPVSCMEIYEEDESSYESPQGASQMRSMRDAIFFEYIVSDWGDACDGIS